MPKKATATAGVANRAPNTNVFRLLPTLISLSLSHHSVAVLFLHRFSLFCVSIYIFIFLFFFLLLFLFQSSLHRLSKRSRRSSTCFSLWWSFCGWTAGVGWYRDRRCVADAKPNAGTAESLYPGGRWGRCQNAARTRLSSLKNESGVNERFKNRDSERAVGKHGPEMCGSLPMVMERGGSSQ